MLTLTEATEKPGSNSVLMDRFLLKGLSIGEIPVFEVAVQTPRGSDKVTGVDIRFSDVNERNGSSKREFAFDNARRFLIQKYGVPKNEDQKKVENGDGDVEKTALWTFPSTSITLIWHEIRRYDLGYVSVQYKAADKKSLDSL